MRFKQPPFQALRVRLLTAAAIAILAVPPPVSAQADAGHSQPQADAAHSQGQAVFQRLCAACHLSLVQTGGLQAAGPDAHAVPREMLHRYTPEAVLNALTNGKMQAQGSTLTDAERRAVAEFVTGTPFGASRAALPVTAGRLCTQPAPAFDPEADSWMGWGNGSDNARFQDHAQGRLTAADLPDLKLKWAFGFANVPASRTQPAVAGGRLFAASDNGAVYALDPRSGCTYWMFKAQAGVPTALRVAPYQKAGTKGFAVLFGDSRANAYAVDAQTGQQLWTVKVDDHPRASITGGAAFYDGKVFFPIQGVGEEGQGIHSKDGCCTLRGSVTAIDIGTGKVLWKTWMVPEEPKLRGKATDGVPVYGPSGVGIWSSPTVDAKRGLLYVSTGNAYSNPPQAYSDAVVALDITTGKVRWASQVLPNDVWAMGCAPINPADSGCPEKLGPDYDFSASPVLATVNGHDLLVLPQKSGLAFAFDPDHNGKILWQRRIGQGSGLGGQWGAAVADGKVFIGTADLLAKQQGGFHALNLADGSVAWASGHPKGLCAGHMGCRTGQGSAPTVIPGAVLSSVTDGSVRAYSIKTGKVIWILDTNHEFTTVNGVKGQGGSMDGASPIVVGGMLYVSSGNGGLLGQPGNVLLAYGLD